MKIMLALFLPFLHLLAEIMTWGLIATILFELNSSFKSNASWKIYLIALLMVYCISWIIWSGRCIITLTVNSLTHESHTRGYRSVFCVLTNTQPPMISNPWPTKVPYIAMISILIPVILWSDRRLLKTMKNDIR